MHLEVPFHVLVKRLSARRQCQDCCRVYNGGLRCDDCEGPLVQRIDDREDVIRERLRTYQVQTDPVVEFYLHGRYHILNADRPPDDVFRDIEGLLELAMVRTERTSF